MFIINNYWQNLTRDFLPTEIYNNIKFIHINDLHINTINNESFIIYIFEPLRLNYKIKLNNFIQMININFKNKIKFKIINSVIKIQ